MPMGAVVTAFGTGAEMNNGAVITHTEKMLKSALWGAFYDFAILDPAYTMTMPMKQVISGAFDTLSHCMETYFGSPREDNLSDEINEAVMRSTIKNLRTQIANPDDKTARSELLWAAAMGENGILKIGKATDFQCHMMEHQLGAYTDCNHGMGLSAMHVPYYRYIVEKGAGKFAKFATRVWGVDPEGKSELEVANAGLDALAAFIREIGMPSNFRELGIPDDLPWKEIADSVTLTSGGYGHLTHEDVRKIFEECRG
ncbi:MAG: iron-containing alcohol dehydrogenase [Oscillospiraceae bacterium]|nr:iron-containing alcohol dehydrogenase [Oscillospiraceae bacterium]